MMARWLAYYDEESETIHATLLEAGRHGYIGVSDDRDDAVRLLQDAMRYEADYLRTRADKLDNAASRGLCDG